MAAPKVVSIDSATKAGKSRSFDQGTTATSARSIKAQTSGTGDGGQSDWRQSVETRLGDLRTDVRNLLIGGAVVAMGLLAAGWTVYTSAMSELRQAAVRQQEIAGKIETLEARIAGRMELMEERLSPRQQGGDNAGSK